jgi:hypothetical protein
MCPLLREYLRMDRCLEYEHTIGRLIKAFADREMSLWLKGDMHLNMVLK